MPLAAAQSRGRSEFYGHGVKSRVADQGGPPAGARPAGTLGPRIWFNRAAVSSWFESGDAAVPVRATGGTGCYGSAHKSQRPASGRRKDNRLY